MTPADNTPDFDSMSPEEIMTWMESLAKRQGVRPEELTTAADVDIPEIDPNSVVIDEPGYVPYGEERPAKPPARPAAQPPAAQEAPRPVAQPPVRPMAPPPAAQEAPRPVSEPPARPVAQPTAHPHRRGRPPRLRDRNPSRRAF